MIEIFQYTFIRNAIIAAVLVNITCGIVGTFVVVKRIALLSGGISHATFGGIGLGYFLGINPVLTAIPFSLASAFAIGVLSKKGKLSEDTAIGIFWAAGMALGVIFINLTPGYAPDLFSYLFGNILTIPVTDLYIMLALDFIVVVLVIVFFKELSAISFDEEFSAAIGIPNNVFYIMLLAMVSLSAVLLIRIVGIILVIALLTIPAAICRQFTYSIKKLIISSMITGTILTIGGLSVSYILDMASGATIILLLVLAFILSFGVKKIFVLMRIRGSRNS
ncbi:MAG: metal ABC transporter permease [Actinobacteria bacterium]|nr:metal ABC transporter permease [Actinomycetota bacterium]